MSPKSRTAESRKRNRRFRRRQSSHLGKWLVGGVVLVIGLGVLNLWWAGAFANPPPPSRSEDSVELLPLTTAGPPLQGGHDMALIPEQTPAPQPAPEDAPAPRLDMPSVSYDFGRVYSRWDVMHIFAVQNTGTADLVLSNLVTSCGCTTAELSSTVIPPGHRADLTVTFDVDYHPVRGRVTRLVWFATNDPTQPWVEVRITADVR